MMRHSWLDMAMLVAAILLLIPLVMKLAEVLLNIVLCP